MEAGLVPRCLVLVDNAFVSQSINYRDCVKIGSLGSFVISASGCVDYLLDGGAKLRSLTGIVRTPDHCLRCALSCLWRIRHETSLELVLKNKTRYYAVVTNICQTKSKDYWRLLDGYR